jgi:hypothetical protein
MASVTDRSDSERYYGESPASIARRVWGNRAVVRRTEIIGDGCYLGQVLQNAKGGRVMSVLANVVIRPDDHKG